MYIKNWWIEIHGLLTLKYLAGYQKLTEKIQKKLAQIQKKFCNAGLHIKLKFIQFDLK